MKGSEYDPNLHAWKACCQFGLCNYKEAQKECELAPDSDLKVCAVQRAGLEPSDAAPGSEGGR